MSSSTNNISTRIIRSSDVISVSSASKSTSSRPRSWSLGNATLVVAERSGWRRVLGATKLRLSAKGEHPYRKRACLEARSFATTKPTQGGTGYPSWGHPTQLRISRGSTRLISCNSGDGTHQTGPILDVYDDDDDDDDYHAVIWYLSPRPRIMPFNTHKTLYTRFYPNIVSRNFISWLQWFPMWTVRRSNPSDSEIFRTHPDRPWDPANILYNGKSVAFPASKEAGRGLKHPPTSSA